MYFALLRASCRSAGPPPVFGLLLAGALVALAVTPASAGPWTRDRGSFYVQASYSRLVARDLFLSSFDLEKNPDYPAAQDNKFRFCPPPEPGQLDCSYIQQTLNFYGEFGVVSRWLTLTLDATLLRDNLLENLGRTRGIGDWSIGAWTGLLVDPVHLALGFTVGLPFGDSRPSAGKDADPVKSSTAASLPTGDGEFDFDTRLSLGHSVGGKRYWPLMHYFIAEAGYWLRTGRYEDFSGHNRRYSDAFVYRAEIGTQLPWKVLNRFWFVFRLVGVESFADDERAAQGATGLGNGVTYTVVGAAASVKIWKGLGLLGSYERAVRGRSLAVGDFFRVGLTFER